MFGFEDVSSLCFIATLCGESNAASVDISITTRIGISFVSWSCFSVFPSAAFLWLTFMPFRHLFFPPQFATATSQSITRSLAAALEELKLSHGRHRQELDRVSGAPG